MKKILLIGTGGTIEGITNTHQTAVYESGKLGIDLLLSDIPARMLSSVNIETCQILSIDSREMTVDKWVKISNFINKKSKSNSYDGFVVAHGTDTLEETAYFLNLTLKTDKPVVITGSMRPANAMSADSLFNLYQSIILASKDCSRGKGVLVLFNDTIYSAQNVQKNDCFKVNAFDGKDTGSLGIMRDDNVFFVQNILKKHTIHSEFHIENNANLPKVEICYFYAGANLKILEAAKECSDGLVISGVGNGGCNEVWENRIEEYTKAGFPIVKSTRVPNGTVMSEKEDSDLLIYSNELSPQKSRILLMLGLTKTHNTKVLQKYFYEY